jgi:putative multiple sugar transport system substrate-binding protein
MRKVTFVLLAILLTAPMMGVFAGGSGQQAATTPLVGIAMPTQSSSRWISDGNTMRSLLQERGFRVDLQYAEDNIDVQISQIENMITRGARVLVIAAIDGESLTNVLEQANRNNIPVIAYDRLIRNTPHVSYYATFDNFLVGVLQAESIVEALNLSGGAGPFNIELFAGSPDDNNAYFFFDGAMSVLQRYIDNRQLVVRSGQTDFAQVATLRWDGATAQQRMDNLIAAHYTAARVDAVLSPYDGISIGILSALRSAGYGTSARPWPIVSGQDAELPSVKSILAGEQHSTIFKDTRVLAQRAVNMVESVLRGVPAEVNDTTTYDNGVKVVPSFLEVPVTVDIRNWEEVLVGSGYYTLEQIRN